MVKKTTNLVLFYQYVGFVNDLAAQEAISLQLLLFNNTLSRQFFMATHKRQFTHVTVEQPGKPTVMTMTQSTLDLPSAGQVTIKVYAAGVNGPDIKQRVGAYPPPAGRVLLLVWRLLVRLLLWPMTSLNGRLAIKFARSYRAVAMLSS
ncbi:hypothetical protein GCM10011607_38070 [Shewanella inventionis]|uniref:Uncharacterized protein n=1 Tax=Shewanella inventionis TaxID=1738770 RepID=A0ABQ1JP60_9GAMM|nr:hypothetical protein GCM10011607_38070 [Shewanella inventionis]